MQPHPPPRTEASRESAHDPDLTPARQTRIAPSTQDDRDDWDQENRSEAEPVNLNKSGVITSFDDHGDLTQKPFGWKDWDAKKEETLAQRWNDSAATTLEACISEYLQSKTEMPTLAWLMVEGLTVRRVRGESKAMRRERLLQLHRFEEVRAFFKLYRKSELEACRKTRCFGLNAPRALISEYRTAFASRPSTMHVHPTASELCVHRQIPTPPSPVYPPFWKLPTVHT